MVTLEMTLGAVGLSLLIAAYLTHRQQRAALGRGPRLAPLERYPSVSVIRPIRGLDTGAAENLRAALDPGYPGEVETLFVLDDEAEPALPLVRAAIAERRATGRARILLAGQPPAGRTGKLNAMIAGLREARGEIIVFADSDIRPDRDALRVLVATLLSSPTAGSAFAPVIATLPPATAGDAGYALLLNGLYGPAAALASKRRGGTLPFIMGQFMAFRREALMAIGGLEVADGQLVDDMFLGDRVRAAGFDNLVAPHAVPVIQRGLQLWPFLRTYRRWLTFSRSGLPGRDFKIISWLRGGIFWSGIVGAAATASVGASWAAVTMGLSAIALAASVNRLHVRFGGAPLSWRHAWVSFAALLAAPAVYLSILVWRKLSWRGRRYSLTTSSRLAAAGRTGSAAPQIRGAGIGGVGDLLRQVR